MLGRPYLFLRKSMARIVSAARDNAAQRANNKASSPAVAGKGASTSSAKPPSKGSVANSYTSRVQPASFVARAATRYRDPGVNPIKGIYRVNLNVGLM